MDAGIGDGAATPVAAIGGCRSTCEITPAMQERIETALRKRLQDDSTHFSRGLTDTERMRRSAALAEETHRLLGSVEGLAKAFGLNQQALPSLQSISASRGRSSLKYDWWRTLMREVLSCFHRVDGKIKHDHRERSDREGTVYLLGLLRASKPARKRKADGGAGEDGDGKRPRVAQAPAADVPKRKAAGGGAQMVGNRNAAPGAEADTLGGESTARTSFDVGDIVTYTTLYGSFEAAAVLVTPDGTEPPLCTIFVDNEVRQVDASRLTEGTGDTPIVLRRVRLAARNPERTLKTSRQLETSRQQRVMPPYRPSAPPPPGAAYQHGGATCVAAARVRR